MKAMCQEGEEQILENYLLNLDSHFCLSWEFVDSFLCSCVQLAALI